MSELYDQIEELMLELEDEDTDPVGGQTIAIVPGAFKPPHLGHLDMVKQYASQADKVIVLISSPLKASRGIAGKPITARQSMEIWEMLLDDAGLSNVQVEISPKPSPISAAYEYIDKDGPLEPGTNVILGASRKGGDFKRWRGAAKYVKPGVNLHPPEETAVVPADRPSGEPYSATDARKMLEQGEDADEFFGDGRTAAVRSILGLDQLEEMSGAGAVAGYSLPLGAHAVVGSEKRKKKKKQKEYNELYLYKEVLKLLTTKGIIK
mgnify:FL=1